MDSDFTPEPAKAKSSPLKMLLAPLKLLFIPLNIVSTVLGNLPIPKKLKIPVIAGAALLIAGGAAFAVFHARGHVAPSVKTVASAPVASKPGTTTGASSEAGPSEAGSAPAGVSTAANAAACSGVVNDIYRQTVDEDPSVTLAQVRSEVLTSGVSCAPVPEIAAKLKDLSPPCRDIVQYTYLEAREGHMDIEVDDVREKVVPKSVACEHDRKPK